MDRGAPRATVPGVAKELDMTKQINHWKNIPPTCFFMGFHFYDLRGFKVQPRAKEKIPANAEKDISVSFLTF